MLNNVLLESCIAGNLNTEIMKRECQHADFMRTFVGTFMASFYDEETQVRKYN